MCANVFLKLHVHYSGIIELPDGREALHTRAAKSARFNFERLRSFVRSFVRSFARSHVPVHAFT